MPFILSKQFHPRGKLFFVRDEDCDLIPTPVRDKATRMDEVQADALAADHNRYSETEMIVEGAKS